MFKRLSGVAIATAVLMGLSLDASAQMGHVMQGAGATNRAMQGASTGGGTDPAGALYWNVAGLSRLEASSFSIDAEYFSNRLELSSRRPAALTPPGASTTGAGFSDYGPSIIPSFTFVYVPGASDRDAEGYQRSKWTFALGMQSVAGFGVNHDTDAVNPILNPQTGGGFGALSSEFIMGQLTFGTSYQVTDKLALGFAPVLAFSMLEVDPFPGAAPGLSGYPATDMEMTIGYGFQFGIMYQVSKDWSVGASHKTTTNFQAFKFDGKNGANDFSFDMDMPSITSAGVSFTGINNLMLNADLRYIDYDHTDGFSEDAEFDSSGAVKGFGWDSIWQIAIGASYKCTDKFTLLCGYSYNENPIDDDITFFNVHAPAIIQHHASLGFEYQATKNSLFKLGWAHGFKNSIEGPMVSAGFPGQPPAGPIKGTSVKSEMSTDSLLFGYEYTF